MKETLLVPTYLERKSSIRSSCPSLFGSPALLSLITLFLSLRLGRGNDDLWGKGKGSRKGENHRRKRCSPVDRSLITRDCYSSLSRDWSKKKRAKKKKTFLVAGLSARLCLRGGASGSLYKRSRPGGGRVRLPFKRGRRLAALV